MSTILIAYERESEQLALEKIFSSRGHSVVKAGTGVEALDLARRDPPSLIVCDILLPTMDGISLCRKWKHDERLRYIPFIFYSTRYGDPKYERFALDLGVERFLARPAPMELLLTAVDEVLQEANEKTQTAARPAVNVAPRAVPVNEDAIVSQQFKERIAELEAQSHRVSAEAARFRHVFDANPTAQWLADIETDKFIAVNDAALALYGHTRLEFLALTPQLLLADSDQLGPLGPGLVWHARKDGRLLTVALATRVIDFGGRKAAVVSVSDASSRVRAERETTQAVAAQRALLAVAPDGCWIIDAEGRLLDVNDAYCRMSGYRREELLQLHAEDLERSTSGATTVLLNLTRTASRDRYETKHRRKDGLEFEAEVTVGALDDDNGRSILFIRDVSERRAQRRRERAGQHRLEALVELFLHAEEMEEQTLMARTTEHLARAATSPLAFVYCGETLSAEWSSAGWFDSVAGKAHFEAGPIALDPAPPWITNVRSGRAVLNNDMAVISQPKPLPTLHRLLAFPVALDSDRLIVVGVANRLRDYNDDDRREVKRLGDLLARLLRSKRSRMQLATSLQQAEAALHSSIGTLVALAERHDPYTAGSALRVAELAIAIARELGLENDKQRTLRMAAVLHDIGMTVVPAELLARPFQLSTHEYALVQLHAAEGARLLSGIELEGPVAEIVHQHHERWNGSGYPRGLAGDAILFEARILAVADVVEAMLSNRPHRTAPGRDIALNEIQQNAGKLYDPRVTEACARLFLEQRFKWSSGV